MNDPNKSVDSSGTPAPSGSPSQPRQLRVRKSTAAMMAASRPASRSPWGAAVVLFLLLAGGIAAWWFRADWWPQTRGWWEAHRPGAAKTAPAAPRAEASPVADVEEDAAQGEEFVEFAQGEPASPEPEAVPETPEPAAVPAVPAARGRNAGSQPSPAALFNEAFRDYQTFLTDKQAHADMLPDIIERAFRAAKGFEAMLDLADDEKKAQVNEAMSQCYRLISDCRRQNTEAARSLQEPSTSTHAPFNRATVGPKRKPPLRPPEPAPAASP